MQIKIVNQIALDGGSINLDRSSLFGDGFFTTGVIKSNQLIFRKQHLDRLKQSAQKLLFPPLDLVTISASIDRLCLEHTSAIIRIDVFRQQSQRGYALSKDATTQVNILMSPYKERGFEYCELFDAKTEVSSNRSLAGIKHLNRLDSVLAASEVQEANHEALMYQQKNLICGSKSNIFVLLNGQWITPSLEQCGVSGIMRQNILSNMKQRDISCKISDISLHQTKDISAAFITNCIFGAWSASHFNGRKLDLNASNRLIENFYEQ